MVRKLVGQGPGSKRREASNDILPNASPESESFRKAQDDALLVREGGAVFCEVASLSIADSQETCQRRDDGTSHDMKQDSAPVPFKAACIQLIL